jgi:IstB-like ATP binding protein
MGRRSELQTPDTRQYDAASPGVGKTHLAVATGRAAILTGYAVLFIQATTLVAALARAHGEGRLEDKLTRFAKPRLLMSTSSATCRSSPTPRTCSSSSAAAC